MEETRRGRGKLHRGRTDGCDDSAVLQVCLSACQILPVTRGWSLNCNTGLVAELHRFPEHRMGLTCCKVDIAWVQTVPCCEPRHSCQERESSAALFYPALSNGSSSLGLSPKSWFMQRVCFWGPSLSPLPVSLGVTYWCACRIGSLVALFSSTWDPYNLF